MLDFLLNGEVIAGLLTLTALEIVLGIDNIIFLSLITSRLPQEQQKLARQIGLALALAGRIGFLLCITWLMKAQEPLFTLLGVEVSWRSIILMLGGLFLIYKSVNEMHHTVEGGGEERKTKALTFRAALIQIAVIDMVFALDSMITAVGMSDLLWVMITANVIAMAVMLVASEAVAGFIARHPSLKILALSFLLMVGVALIADATSFHIPRGYIYFSLAFSAGTEFLNIMAHSRRPKKGKRGE